MGLGTTHNAWSGSYSAFGQWVQALATAAGYDLVEVGTDKSWFTYVSADIADDLFTPEHARGDWDSEPEDILLVLLTHSDTDGHIHPHHAGPLADRLDGLIPALDTLRPPLEAGETRPVPYGYECAPAGEADRLRRATARFVRGLRTACEAGEVLEFR